VRVDGIHVDMNALKKGEVKCVGFPEDVAVAATGVYLHLRVCLVGSAMLTM
jgi:hypothetical protein